MSDPVLAFVLIASFLGAVAAASYFKTLDSAFPDDARVALIVGLVAGLVIRFVDSRVGPHAVVVGLILTIAALYVRLTGRESEPAEGMCIGAMMGATAAVVFVIGGEHELVAFAECVLAGAVAGYGITFALTHVRVKVRQAVIDAVTAALAIGVVWSCSLLVRGRVTERQLAVFAAVIVPLLVVGTVFKQWRAIRDELVHEAALGVIDDEDVRVTAHPILRFGRGGWHDAHAHREFVRIASKIALRKRQQRGRSEEVARLYQLELLKLRQQLQDMTSIDRAMRAHSEREQVPG